MTGAGPVPRLRNDTTETDSKAVIRRRADSAVQEPTFGPTTVWRRISRSGPIEPRSHPIFSRAGRILDDNLSQCGHRRCVVGGGNRSSAYMAFELPCRHRLGLRGCCHGRCLGVRGVVAWIDGQAMRMEFGRPRSSMRLRTWTATSTSYEVREIRAGLDFWATRRSWCGS